jgi:CHAT domain-containing protein/tetratricopeptide (TPR) repeat protein
MCICRHSVLIMVLMSVLMLLCVDEAACVNYPELLAESDSLILSGQFDSSFAIARYVLAQATEELGDDDTIVAEALNLMGGYHYMKAEYDAAQACWTRSLSIREQVLGPDRLEVAYLLDGLGQVETNNGDYAKAEYHFERALEIAENVAGPNSIEVTVPLNHLALASMWLGRYEHARAYFQRSKEIMELTESSTSRQMHTALSSMAIIDREEGRLEESELNSLKALELGEELYGQYNLRLSPNLLNLARVLLYLDRPRESEKVLKRYLDIRKRDGSGEGIPVSTALTGLTRIYYDLGDSTQFRECYETALHNYEDAFDRQDQFLARDMQSFSWQIRPFDGKNSLKFARRAFEIRKHNLRKNYRLLPEQKVLEFAESVRGATATYLSCYLDLMGELPYESEAADIILACKGQVTDVMFERSRLLKRDTSSTVRILSDSLAGVKSRLSRLFVSAESDMSKDEYESALDSLRSERERLDSELARQLGSLGGSSLSAEISAKAVAQHLPANSTLIEYMRFPYMHREPDTTVFHYLVLVVKPGGPGMIRDLGPADSIEQIVSVYRDHMIDASEAVRIDSASERDYRKLASKLHVKIWQPVERLIDDGELVFVAPDGALALVSFASLIDDDGKYLVEKNPIHYLSSGRDLLRPEQQGESGDGLLIMGDPDYNASAQDRLLVSKAPVSPGNTDLAGSASAVKVSLSARLRPAALTETSVERLPGTRSEVDQVVRFWNQAFDDTVYCFLDKSATEDNLKEYASGRRVIHLATHGFFMPSNTDQALLRDYAAGTLEIGGENPLLLSGLFLAGSNLRGLIADSLNIDDGILTAEEVTCLDLTGVDWVVLSACESGLGEIKLGEGVYGLRRAFQVSGAHTIISSLWPVADRNTAEFMSYLYSASDQPLFSSIRQYQLNLLHRLRSHGYPDHPCQWAAFVSTGDWR